MEKNLFIDNQCIVNNYFRYLSFFFDFIEQCSWKITIFAFQFSRNGLLRVQKSILCQGINS